MFFNVANFQSGFGFLVYNDDADIHDPHCEIVYGPTTDPDYKFYDTPEEAMEAGNLYLNPKKAVKTKQDIFSTFTSAMFLSYNRKCADILSRDFEESEEYDLEEMQALIMKINYIIDFEFLDEELETLNKIFELAGVEVK